MILFRANDYKVYFVSFLDNFGTTFGKEKNAKNNIVKVLVS